MIKSLYVRVMQAYFASPELSFRQFSVGEGCIWGTMPEEYKIRGYDAYMDSEALVRLQIRKSILRHRRSK